MRQRAVLHLAGAAAAALLLLTWGISINCGGVRDKAGALLAGINNADQIKPKFKSTAAAAAATAAPAARCHLPRACPPGHFALRVTSGAADVVGPNICFQGKTIMSHVLNNVGPGLNIVVVDGESGAVEKFGYLNMKAGRKGGTDALAYLKAIRAGAIVLVASYDDVTAKMTKEMREIFVGMGSTLIKSVKVRDSWVFVGRAGTGNRSSFEKRAPNNPKTNIYEKWPATVEVSGCFPRSPDGHTP